MISIKEYSFYNKRVLLRADLNVPLTKEGKVLDATRIVAVVPTIKKIIEDGGKLILISHLGRPKGKADKSLSLEGIKSVIEENVGKSVKFINACIGDCVEEMVADLKSGEILLLENLRFYKEEMEGDKLFSKQLASYADIYVNDAYGTAHRKHASTFVVPSFFSSENKLVGFLLNKELISVEHFLDSGKSPITAIIGGAKVSSKIKVLENILLAVDKIIIGGGMVYTFIKASGGEIGKSLYEPDYLAVASSFIAKAKSLGVEVFFPPDTVAASEFSATAKITECNTFNISSGFMGLDIGRKSIAFFSEIIKDSNTVLWNGPMGVFELEPFSKGTAEIAKCVAEVTSKGGFTMVGGGDSVAAINKFNLTDKISHLSTGGGAMLKHLEGKGLPAIEALR